MRAMMEERVRQGAALSESQVLMHLSSHVTKFLRLLRSGPVLWIADTSDTVLYFGCRSLSADQYFTSDWQSMRESGAQIRIAASRDGPPDSKVYVQDLIKQDAKQVRDWLLGKQGWVFICGSSGAMPRQVREALAWCLSKEGGGGSMSEEQAGEWIERLFEDGRGGEESW